MHRLPIEQRKQTLTKLVRGPHPGITLNEHYVGDGDIVYEHACKLGCEGIVSKRLGSLYRCGRSKHWLKIKNPNAPVVKRIGTLGPAIAFALVAFIGGFLAALHPAHNGAVMSQLPSQVLIVVAFAALCFGCGYLAAFIVTRNKWRDEMIERGIARYNWQTGKWEWGEPPKESRH